VDSAWTVNDPQDEVVQIRHPTLPATLKQANTHSAVPFSFHHHFSLPHFLLHLLWLTGLFFFHFCMLLFNSCVFNFTEIYFDLWVISWNHIAFHRNNGFVIVMLLGLNNLIFSGKVNFCYTLYRIWTLIHWTEEHLMCCSY